MKEKLGKHKKLVACAAILVIVLAVAVIFFNSVKKKREMMLEVMNQQETALLERRTLVSSVSATGIVTSTEKKELSAGLTGTEVEEVLVEVGDVVAAGDILCTFISEDIEQNLADAKASLDSTVGKTKIEVSAAERNLAEAQVSRNIAAERADANVADAWNDYLESLTDLDEAQEEWNTAQKTANDKKGEYERCLKTLEETKTKLENMKASGGQRGSYETQFTDAANALKSYVDKEENVEPKDGTMDRIYLTSPDLDGMTAGDFTILNDESGEKENAVSGYLETLKSVQKKYGASSASDADHQELLKKYQSLEAEAAEWKAKYEAAEKSAEGYESVYKQAKSASESLLDAYKRQVENQEDSARNNDSSVASRTDNLSSAKLTASVSSASDRQRVKDYEEQLEDCTVKAPISGIVTAVNVEAGDTYNGSVILTIEDNSAYEISAEIDEYEIGKIKEGQSVVIKTNGTGEEELAGTVKKIAPRATPGGSEVTYNVTISVDTPNEFLRMDMTAKLSIILESRENVLTVPYEAVQEEEDGTYFIEAVKGENEKDTQKDDGSKKAEKRQTEKIVVTKGIESDYYIEVMGELLTEGMEVVVPKSGEGSMDIREMILQQGPMGGF